MFKRVFRLIYSYLSAIRVYCSSANSHSSFAFDEKVIFVDIENNVYSRFIYIFLKFFKIEGYRIYLPNNLHLIAKLHYDQYASLLLKEGIIEFGQPEAGEKTIVINRNTLDSHFFLEILKGKFSDNSYHVPLSQHPLMYHKGLWDSAVPGNDGMVRKKSLFMSGNFDRQSYQNITRDGIFEVSTRSEIFAHLEAKDLLYWVNDRDGLTKFLEGESDEKVILVQKSYFSIPQEELRSICSRFDFFFALPGIVIPFAHNIIEAMSVGTIPFIQEGYARMFRPRLVNGKNAFIYKDLDSIEDKIKELFSLTKDEISRVRRDVYGYYNQFLTPWAVVSAIENTRFDKIYLQAERFSVQLLKIDADKS